MEQQLNRELVRIATISNNNGRTIAEQQEHRDKKDLIKFLLSENTTPIIGPTNNDYFNTNLFYHIWLFPAGKPYTSLIITGLNLTKYPYIGLFHPHGSISAIANQWAGQNVPLNNIASISQYFHDAYSPKTSYIHIDRENDGKAYTVCVDWDETNRPGVRLSHIRGIVTLLIYISDPYEIIMPQNSTIENLITDSFNTNNTGLLTNLVDSLSTIKGLYKILKSWEIELFKNITNINLDQSNRLFLYDYRDAGDTSRYYNPILRLKLDINQDNIPYINEIKSKLLPFFTQTVIDTITWEFEIQIVSRPF